MRRVTTTWRLIDIVLKEHAHSVFKSLRAPATTAAIAKLQKCVPVKLPTSFVESLAVHDGMADYRTARQRTFINFKTLLPVTGVIANLKMQWDL
ncbi:hypothetical protein BH11PLA2_BH11PLA2_03570 [soil metagenome]